jgi:Flp pilus assembly protein TadB
MAPSKAQIDSQGGLTMPLTHFLGLIALVILAAGLTLWLAFATGLPLVALAFGALLASLILTWTRVSR